MITQYHRPFTLDDAVALLARPDAIVLAGGTSVNASPDRTPKTAVDIQALDLEGIEIDGDVIRIGATSRLQDVMDSNLVPSVLRDLARREAPSTIRNMATVGGTIGAADSESELLAGLLAFGTQVTLARAGSSTEHALEGVLADRSLLSGSIITGIAVAAAGQAAADRVARTPMDRPIVAAVAFADGETVRLAMTGVAAIPILVDPDEVADLDPPPDFRGTSDYRRRLAEVLTGRVVAAVTGGESS